MVHRCSSRATYWKSINCYNHLVDLNGILIFLYSAMITPCISHDRWRSTFHPTLKSEYHQFNLMEQQWLSDIAIFMALTATIDISCFWLGNDMCHLPQKACPFLVTTWASAYFMGIHTNPRVAHKACFWKIIITYKDPMVATYLGVLKL